MASSSSSEFMRAADFSADPILAFRASMFSSASADLGGQLVLRSLELVDAAKSLGLVLGLPQLDLRLGLAQGLENVVLLLGLLVDLHPQVLRLRAESLELGEQGSAVASLTV